MSHVPAKIRTRPAHRSCPKATSTAAKKVRATPTTVTWLGVSGERPSAEMRASAWRRTHASNRVVNTCHLQCPRGLRGERLPRLVVHADHLGGDQVPGVAARLLPGVLGKALPHPGVPAPADEGCPQLAPVVWGP